MEKQLVGPLQPRYRHRSTLETTGHCAAPRTEQNAYDSGALKRFGFAERGSLWNWQGIDPAALRNRQRELDGAGPIEWPVFRRLCPHLLSSVFRRQSENRTSNW
jgi:hypothetical protein